VSELSVAQKQIIEIAKAIAQDAKVIIMDEPTASLSAQEVRKLFNIMKTVKQQNVTILFISHKLEEIFEIGDYVTVLRDGHVVGTKRVSEVEGYSELVQMMTGKIIKDHFVPSQIDYSTKVLEVADLNSDKLHSMRFTLFKGEILGFFGLLGAGKTEIARAIYKADPTRSLQLTVNGTAVRERIPRGIIRRGISMVPEERRSQGLIGVLSIRSNINLMNYHKVARLGMVSAPKELENANEYIDKLKIVARNAEQNVYSLSGGNQQKVVVAKCLSADTDIILMDEPTRGVDVGAKSEVHNIIRELSREGKSIIIFTSELQEIVDLCDRIILLYEGRMVRELKNGELDTLEVMNIVAGGERIGNLQQS
jgi:ribose transport system ATP-binding protein